SVVMSTYFHIVEYNIHCMEYSVRQYVSPVKGLGTRQIQNPDSCESGFEIEADAASYSTRFNSALICCAAPCSRGIARFANSSSSRLFGPDTETAVGVGAPGTLTAKQRTPNSCSSSSMA